MTLHATWIELNLIQNIKLNLNTLNEIQILLNSNSIDKEMKCKLM
jgi:hypothetical protein